MQEERAEDLDKNPLTEVTMHTIENKIKMDDETNNGPKPKRLLQ